MVEIITSFALKYALELAFGTASAAIITWILKKIPTAKARQWIYTVFFKIGVKISAFFAHWKFTKSIWNNSLEPWIIGFVDMIFGAIISGLFDGLRSDNEKETPAK